MKKTTHNDSYDTVYHSINDGINKDVLHLITSGSSINGNTIPINGKELINFQTYSYLGLDQHPKLIEGCIDVTRKYGTQWGSSVAYIKSDIHKEYETLLGEIFGAPTTIAASTTIAHGAVMPVLMSKDDVVLLDQQVHSSVQQTAKMLKAVGVTVELVRHNSLEGVEAKINQYKSSKRKIWYLVDGVYSMYGDIAPLKALKQLTDEYEQFYLYVDDAHGMSWKGKNGCGVCINEIGLSEKIVLITSLNKAFCAAGGAIIIKDKEMFDKIMVSGPTLIFCTPVPLPMVGAGIASAKLHLSGGINPLQQKLESNIDRFQTLCNAHGLPLASSDATPIQYIATGSPKVGYDMLDRIMKDGYISGLGLFPAVNTNRTGLRVCLNSKQSFDDIDGFIESVSKNLPESLAINGKTISRIRRDFKLPSYVSVKKSETTNIKVEYQNSIKNIDRKAWDSMLGRNGSFDYNGLLFMENSFSNQEEEHNNWTFHYLIAWEGKIPVAATFFTASLVKDDLFNSADKSLEIETDRLLNKYHLCTKVLSMGSMFSEGNHLYIDKSHSNWRIAVTKIIEKAEDIKEAENCKNLLLRDFEPNIDLQEFMIGNGFARVDIPEANIVDLEDYSIENLLGSKSKKGRYTFRKEVLKQLKSYRSEINRSANSEIKDLWYEMYLNVKRRSHEVNSFDLPRNLIDRFYDNPNWEILELFNDTSGKPLAVGFIYKSNFNYCPMFIGMDYERTRNTSAYKIMLFQVLQRAKNLDLEKVYLGYTANEAKRFVGATQKKNIAFFQSSDDFNSKVMEFSATNSK